MLKRTTKKRNPTIKRRNSKDSDRKKQLDEFLKTRGATKLDYQDPTARKRRIGDLKYDFRCPFCEGWEDDSGEFRHSKGCPKNKRKNPIKSTRVNTFSPLVNLDIGKTSRSNVVLNYEDREITFTGQDASDIRDIIKYQLKLFKGSSKLQREYPGDKFNGGGFYSYLTEVLRDIYPKYIK